MSAKNEKDMNFLILFILIIVSTATYSQKSGDEIFKENNPSVVCIEVYDINKSLISSGSGFVVNDDGLIVTNYHVIENAFYAKILFSDKTISDANYVYCFNENQDLAILKTYSKVKDYVKIGSSDNIEIGEKCFAIGCPLEFTNMITDGIISKVQNDGKDYFFLISTPISPGSSGGGLFNESGRLIGVTTASHKRGQNINLAVPSKYVVELINGHYNPVHLKDFQKKISKDTPKKYDPPKKKSDSKGKKASTPEIPEIKPAVYSLSSYSLRANYNFHAFNVSNNLPSYIKFDKAYSVSFFYLFNKYSGIGLVYQKNYLKDNNTKKDIKLDFYKADFIFRTSENNFRLLLGFGLGLAYSQLVYNSDAENSDLVKIDKAKNLFVGSFLGGIEYRFIQNASIDINVPFDFILLNDKDSFGIASPGVALNILF